MERGHAEEMVRDCTLFLFCLLVMRQRQNHRPKKWKPPTLYRDEIGTYRIGKQGRIYISLNPDYEPKSKALALDTDEVGTYRASKTGRMYIGVKAPASSSSPSSPS